MTTEFTNAKTSVFLDVEDFPNPNNGRSFHEIIKSALEKENYFGEVSITAYGEKEPDNLDGLNDFVHQSLTNQDILKVSMVPLILIQRADSELRDWYSTCLS